MKKCSCVLLLSIAMVLAACSDKGVSKEEFDAVVKERDDYKALYEALRDSYADSQSTLKQDTETGLDNTEIIAYPTGNLVSGDDPNVEFSADGSEVIIALTKDNFFDYFEICSYETVDDDQYYNLDRVNPWPPDEPIPQTTFTHFYVRSKLYDDGWIYKEDSPDFYVKFSYPAGGRYASTWSEAHDLFPMSRLNSFQEEDDLRGNPVVSEITGRLKFARVEAMKLYEIDTFNYTRKCIFPDGTSQDNYIGKEMINNYY